MVFLSYKLSLLFNRTLINLKTMGGLKAIQKTADWKLYSFRILKHKLERLVLFFCISFSRYTTFVITGYCRCRTILSPSQGLFERGNAVIYGNFCEKVKLPLDRPCRVELDLQCVLGHAQTLSIFSFCSPCRHGCVYRIKQDGRFHQRSVTLELRIFYVFP